MVNLEEVILKSFIFTTSIVSLRFSTNSKSKEFYEDIWTLVLKQNYNSQPEK